MMLDVQVQLVNSVTRKESCAAFVGCRPGMTTMPSDDFRSKREIDMGKDFQASEKSFTFETLCGALSKEIERCEELLEAYSQCGHAGVFASTVLSVELEKAHESLMMRDVAAMLKAYATLKECQ